jgi:branched-subunit amino acid permease
MLILNTPICPKCNDCVMTRDLSKFDWFGMALFFFIFFPLAIWIYMTPRRLYCQNCGKVLSPRPAECN